MKKILTNDVIINAFIKFAIWYPRWTMVIIWLSLTAITGALFKGTYINESCGCASGGITATIIGFIVYGVTIIILAHYTELGEDLLDESEYRNSTMQHKLKQEIDKK